MTPETNQAQFMQDLLSQVKKSEFYPSTEEPLKFQVCQRHQKQLHFKKISG